MKIKKEDKIKFINEKIIVFKKKEKIDITEENYKDVIELLIETKNYEKFFEFLNNIIKIKSIKIYCNNKLENFINTFLNEYKNKNIENKIIDNFISINKKNINIYKDYFFDNIIIEFLKNNKDMFEEDTIKKFNDIFMENNNSLLVRNMPQTYSLLNDKKYIEFLEEIYCDMNYNYYNYNLKSIINLKELAFKKIIIDIGKYFEQSFDKNNNLNILVINKKIKKENYLLYKYKEEIIEMFNINKGRFAKEINKLRNKLAHFDYIEKKNYKDINFKLLEIGMTSYQLYYECLRLYISDYTFPIIPTINKYKENKGSIFNISNDILLFYKIYIEKFKEDIIKKDSIIELPKLITEEYYTMGKKKFLIFLKNTNIKFEDIDVNKIKILENSKKENSLKCRDFLIEHYNYIKSKYNEII